MIKSKFLGSGRASEPKIEQNYTENSWHNLQCSGSAQIPSQDNLDDSDQFLSLYRVVWKGKRTELHIYNTENTKVYIKLLDSNPILCEPSCITQLPNGELFCYGGWYSGRTLIIDRNYRVRMLPSGTRCNNSSALYFENNVYCFGGYIDNGRLALSRKFDLKNNRWIDLTSLPSADYLCHSVIFNGKILISGCNSKNLWLYSIEIDSFSIIPYCFPWDIRKVLINVERLYLIEWGYDRLIYESEDEYHWNPISKSGQPFKGYQIYCLYNKENIYILAGSDYYHFDLKKKLRLRLNKAKT